MVYGIWYSIIDGNYVIVVLLVLEWLLLTTDINNTYIHTYIHESSRQEERKSENSLMDGPRIGESGQNWLYYSPLSWCVAFVVLLFGAYHTSRRIII